MPDTIWIFYCVPFEPRDVQDIRQKTVNATAIISKERHTSHGFRNYMEKISRIHRQ